MAVAYQNLNIFLKEHVAHFFSKGYRVKWVPLQNEKVKITFLEECMHTFFFLLITCNILDKYLHIVLTYLRKIGLKHSRKSSAECGMVFLLIEFLYYFCNIAIHVSNNTLHLKKGVIEKFVLFFDVSCSWSSQSGKCFPFTRVSRY